MSLDQIISYLEGVASTVSQLGVPSVSSGAIIADDLLRVIQAAMNAHKAVTGQPLDLNLLQPIEKVP